MEDMMNLQSKSVFELFSVLEYLQEKNDNTDLENAIVEEIESRLTFKDDTEHQMWIDYTCTYMDFDAWKDYTLGIYSRATTNTITIAYAISIALRYANQLEGEIYEINVRNCGKVGTDRYEFVDIVVYTNGYDANGKYFEKSALMKVNGKSECEVIRW